eukprot:jgi/Tetstr1/426887/TSEL_017100.t1
MFPKREDAKDAVKWLPDVWTFRHISAKDSVSDVTKLWEVQRDDCPHAPHEHAEVYDNKVPQSVKAVMRPFIMCDKPGQAIAKLPREVGEKIRDYDGFRTAVRA